MKFRLFPDGFILQIIVLIPVSLFCIGILIYSFSTSSSFDRVITLIFLVPVLAYFFYLFIRRKDYFSYVVIGSDGIRATCFGAEWYKAGWNELQYIGTFSRVARARQDWVYFSKTPVDLEDAEIYGIAPRNSCLKESGIFMETSGAVFDEMQKYIEKDRIKSCGTFKLNN